MLSVLWKESCGDCVLPAGGCWFLPLLLEELLLCGIRERRLSTGHAVLTVPAYRYMAGAHGCGNISVAAHQVVEQTVELLFLKVQGAVSWRTALALSLFKYVFHGTVLLLRLSVAGAWGL